MHTVESDDNEQRQTCLAKFITKCIFGYNLMRVSTRSIVSCFGASETTAPHRISWWQWWEKGRLVCNSCINGSKCIMIIFYDIAHTVARMATAYLFTANIFTRRMLSSFKVAIKNLLHFVFDRWMFPFFPLLWMRAWEIRSWLEIGRSAHHDVKFVEYEYVCLWANIQLHHVMLTIQICWPMQLYFSMTTSNVNWENSSDQIFASKRIVQPLRKIYKIWW